MRFKEIESAQLDEILSGAEQGTLELLCKAIEVNKNVSFTYNTHRRVVEVHCVGRNAKNILARSWQVAGGSVSGIEAGWKLFNLSKIRKAYLMDLESRAPRQGYVNGDSAMTLKIFCEYGDYNSSIDPKDDILDQSHEGDILAQFKLGHIYLKDNQLELAAKWFETAGEAGHIESQLEIGFMYLTGYGVHLNTQSAKAWFELAAENGDPTAQFHLGQIQEDDAEDDEDRAKARKWYELSASQGSDEAKEWLADQVGKEGEGGEESTSWFKKVAKSAVKKGKKKLNKLLSRLFNDDNAEEEE